ncbi:hypothetical protein B0H11DRAFT_1970897 [Mycena galericulata]|nr:hypothetical protein B0H11DRAFT_1970897 [Mycena galericulata]
MAKYLYHRMVLPVFLFPMSALAAFIVDDFTKPALTCEPFLIQWQGGVGEILEASNSAVLENRGSFKGTAFTWNVDLAAGTSVVVALQDSTGATAVSQALTVQSGATSTSFSNPPRILLFRTSATATAPSPSTTTSSSSLFQPNTSPSSVVILPPSTTPTFLSSSATSAAFSTSAPDAQTLSTAKPAPAVGVALGILLPGLLLLGFFCFFLFRRRRRRRIGGRPSGVEELGFGNDARGRGTTPAWFARPAYHVGSTGAGVGAGESSVVSRDLQSSGSYAHASQPSYTYTAQHTSQPSSSAYTTQHTTQPSESVAPSDSASRASSAPFEPSPFAPYPELSTSGSEYSGSATVRWSAPSSASGVAMGQATRMGGFRFPMISTPSTIGFEPMPTPPPPY